MLTSELDEKSIPYLGFTSKSKARWWARRDSNPQPSGYEPPALTIELQARRTLIRCFRQCRQGAEKTCTPHSVHNHNLQRFCLYLLERSHMSRSLLAFAMMVPLIAGMPALAQEVDMRPQIN